MSKWLFFKRGTTLFISKDCLYRTSHMVLSWGRQKIKGVVQKIRQLYTLVLGYILIPKEFPFWRITKGLVTFWAITSGNTEHVRSASHCYIIMDYYSLTQVVTEEHLCQCLVISSHFVLEFLFIYPVGWQWGWGDGWKKLQLKHCDACHHNGVWENKEQKVLSRRTDYSTVVFSGFWGKFCCLNSTHNFSLKCGNKHFRPKSYKYFYVCWTWLNRNFHFLPNLHMIGHIHMFTLSLLIL